MLGILTSLNKKIRLEVYERKKEYMRVYKRKIFVLYL